MTVLDWLLDSDPAIRWQVLRDLVDAPAEVVAAERARVATEGWGARLLALQGEDGQWAGGACFPARSFDWRAEDQGQPWTATLPTLQLLRDFGVDPGADRVRRAVALVRDHCRWEHAGQPFFSGEVEPCINGRTVTLGTYFDQDVDGVVARLLGEQLEDGGWNCEAENGSVRSSFATTINVLEGLLAHERATGGSAESIAARRRGEEYLLERRLFRRKSTGEVVNPAWLQFSFPTRWHYDVLRALEYFRSVGDAPDPRVDEAIELLRSKQQPDGTWLLENTHPGKVHFALEDGDGRPSRWNTLRALRVLDWYEQPRRLSPGPGSVDRSSGLRRRDDAVDDVERVRRAIVARPARDVKATPRLCPEYGEVAIRQRRLGLTDLRRTAADEVGVRRRMIQVRHDRGVPRGVDQHGRFPIDCDAAALGLPSVLNDARHEGQRSAEPVALDQVLVGDQPTHGRQMQEVPVERNVLVEWIRQRLARDR